MFKNANIKQDIFDLSWVVFAVIGGILFAYHSYTMREAWPGIEPAPSSSASLFYGYGDTELSYRNVGLTLQNVGDTGGRVTNFKDYDYGIVEQWLWLADSLDDKANYVPSLAAYFFSAVKDPVKLRHLVGYLAHVGNDPENERWRWLGHAIYLARFDLNDQKLALELANRLAALNNPNMPMWTKIMPAYVRKSLGEKKEARDLLLLIMADPKVKQEQADINQSCWYINKYLREPGDNLDSNEIFKNFCSTELKNEEHIKN